MQDIYWPEQALRIKIKGVLFCVKLNRYKNLLIYSTDIYFYERCFLIQVMMTIFALLCVDKFGRRRLLFTGALVMGISIIALGVACQFDRENIQTKVCVDHSDCYSDQNHNHSFPIDSSIHNPANPITEFSTKDSNVTSLPKILSKRFVDVMSRDFSKSVDESTNFVIVSKRDQPDLSTSQSKGGNPVSGNVKGDNPSKGSKVQRYLGFTALTCYVAAYGFSFGPGMRMFQHFVSISYTLTITIINNILLM